MNSMTRWLDVEVGSDDTDLNTLPSNLTLVDLQNDNEYKLLVADLGRDDEGPKLKVFKGAMQVSEVPLPGLPLGVVGFYISDNVPRFLPIIAVAFSSCVYMYRNLKLFYKYYLPSTEVNMCELEVWKQLTHLEDLSPEAIQPLTDSLKSIPYKMLCPQSQHFLSLTPELQVEHLETHPEVPIKTNPEIVCIAMLRLNSVDRHSVGCLVVATEEGDVIVLDPQMFTQMAQAKVCGVKKTPYQMVTTGLFTVDYRITVATREKTVCLLKRDWSEGKILFTTDDHIIGIEVVTVDHSVMVICADNTLACYSKKGKKQWSVCLEHRPVAMTLVPVHHLGVTMTAVALASGHVHLFDGKARRDTLFVRDVVSVMKFGQLGQEEHVFIIITGSGNLILKILKRTADFSSLSAGLDSGVSVPTQRPWLIPKKSKLFLEQAARERENAVAMHEMFQLELCRLRLTAAKTLLTAHQLVDNSLGTGALEPLRLTAEVEGLGPVFRVTLSISNTSKDKAVIGLSILFHVHTANYKVSNPYMKVPLLPPGGNLKFPTKIEEIFGENINPDILFRPVTGQGGERSLIKVLLLKEGRISPVLAATVQMPPTDPMMLPFDKIQASADNDGWGKS